jgi:hypothetical protein
VLEIAYQLRASQTLFFLYDCLGKDLCKVIIVIAIDDVGVSFLLAAVLSIKLNNMIIITFLSHV